MKLFYTKRSPYARKVRIVAEEKQIGLDLTEVDLANKPEVLLSNHPVGKIPVLLLDDGTSLNDNPVICEYLDSLNNNPLLIPKEENLRLKILNLSAIADGLMDVTVSAFLERVRHPEDFNQDFIESQENTIHRCLKYFDEHLDDLSTLTLAPIAVVSAIGYINFRLPDLSPKKDLPKLAKWHDKFSERRSVSASIPQK